MARHGRGGGGSDTWHFVIVFAIAFAMGWTLGKHRQPLEIPPVNLG